MGIKYLKIERYRGLKDFEWRPSPGVNALIGAADAGKTTVLSAISLLLNPNPTVFVSEYDYHNRNTAAGFKITAVIGDLSTVAKRGMAACLLGWKDNSLQGLPDEDGAETVVQVMVTGSANLELEYQLFQLSGGFQPFRVTDRRNLMMMQIAVGARAMNEMRLGRGSLLDRHINGDDLRSTVSQNLAIASTQLELSEEVKQTLKGIGAAFKSQGLPIDLLLGIITPQERTLLSLVGLLNGLSSEVGIPLAFSGNGTTQLALFVLASSLMQGEPILVVDEPEAGLEPYRQRRYGREIQRRLGTNGQAFITTHSPSVLSVLKGSQVTRMVAGRPPVRMENAALDKLLNEVPVAFLSRLPILCEGATETGLLHEILQHFAESDGIEDIDSLGVTLVTRKGQPSVLNEAQALLDAGIECGLFVDNETNHGGRRAELMARQECAFGSWEEIRNIEEAIGKWLPFEHFPELLILAESLQKGGRMSSLLQQIGQHIGSPGTANIEDLIANGHDEVEIRAAITLAMQGNGGWFKSVEGGQALGRFLLEKGLPEQIEKRMVGFWTRVKLVIGWS